MKKKDSCKAINITIRPSIKKLAKQAAKEDGMSLSAYISSLIISNLEFRGQA